VPLRSQEEGKRWPLPSVTIDSSSELEATTSTTTPTTTRTYYDYRFVRKGKTVTTEQHHHVGRKQIDRQDVGTLCVWWVGSYLCQLRHPSY